MIETLESHVTPSEEMTRPAGDSKIRRRLMLGAVGFTIAAVLFALGAVMTSNADFSRTYVTEQLERQRITFKAAAALTDEERAKACVLENAGKPLTTGKQAECYANDFIGLHVVSLGKGRTYAEMGDVQTALRGQVAKAQADGDPALPGLQKELADLTGQRESVFKAEMLRGALLTSFGFSELGEKGAQAATVANGAGAAMVLLTVAGLGLSVARTRRKAAPSGRAADRQ